MGKVFRPSNREASILSKIESHMEHARRRSIMALKDHAESLANKIATRLIEKELVETKSKNSLEEQLLKCMDNLTRMSDFDIDFKLAPYRTLVPQPNVVSLYLTGFVIETVINHKDTVEIFGSDEEIYRAIHTQVRGYLSS